MATIESPANDIPPRSSTTNTRIPTTPSSPPPRLHHAPRRVSLQFPLDPENGCPRIRSHPSSPLLRKLADFVDLAASGRSYRDSVLCRRSERVRSAASLVAFVWRDLFVWWTLGRRNVRKGAGMAGTIAPDRRDLQRSLFLFRGL